MEAAAHRPRVLAEVDPHVEWVHGDDVVTLLVDVSGFTKDQLKVQVEPSGSLRISGERALDGSGRQWCHFLKRFDLLDAGEAARDAAAIKVLLDRGVLHVRVPRRLCSSTATRADDSSQQQHLAPDRYDDEADAPRGEGEDAAAAAAAVWSGGHTAAWRRGDGRHHPAWRLAARSLSEHRHVVLNVVLAVVLLWLVASGKSKPSGGQTRND